MAVTHIGPIPGSLGENRCAIAPGVESTDRITLKIVSIQLLLEESGSDTDLRTARFTTRESYDGAMLITLALANGTLNLEQL